MNYFRYHWGYEDYSDYKSICSIIDLTGQAIFIPILGMLQLPDANVIPFIIFTVIVRHVIKGFAVQSWMMYLGSSVDLLASYSFSAIRSSVTKCVELHEVGKMLALIYSVESIIPMFMTQVIFSISLKVLTKILYCLNQWLHFGKHGNIFTLLIY